MEAVSSDGEEEGEAGDHAEHEGDAQELKAESAFRGEEGNERETHDEDGDGCGAVM